MNIAIGSIEEMRMSKRNIVKYLIQFKDEDGKIHNVWTNWTAKKNYELGTSIPVKYSRSLLYTNAILSACVALLLRWTTFLSSMKSWQEQVHALCLLQQPQQDMPWANC